MPPRPEADAPITLATLAEQAARVLMAAGFPPASGRSDAVVLIRHLLNWTPADWLTHLRDPVPPGLQRSMEQAIHRRARREPVAYITGRREFYGRPFLVTRDVLVPRPETELVVSEAVAALDERRRCGHGRQLSAADVGTGSGCIAVTLALEAADVVVEATDVSPAALAVARANATGLGAAARVHFRQTSLIGEAVAAYDLVVSNPPYVATTDREALMPDVRDYEPALALYGGADGLDLVRALLPAAARALTPGGWLIMEIGSGQSAAVTDLIGQMRDLLLVTVVRDLAAHPRVAVARRVVPGQPGGAARSV